MTNTERLWTTAELAAYLSLPIRTLHQWSHRGVGPTPIKVGRHNRYTQSAVDEFLAEAEANATSAA